MEKKQNLAYCYDLSFDVETKTFFLKLPLWIVDQMKGWLMGNNAIMEGLFREQGGNHRLFKNFGKPRKPIGYDRVIKWHRRNGDEIIYSHTLSPSWKQTRETCEQCEGSGLRMYPPRDCYDCFGTGKKHVTHENNFAFFLLSLYPIIKFGNLALSEQCIEKSERTWNPKTRKRQKSAVDYSHESGRGECTISAWVQDEVATFIQTLTEEEVARVSETMRQVQEHISSRKKDPYDFQFFRSKDERDNFGFKILGSECTLRSIPNETIGMFGDIGATLYQHNVDARLDQISFIAGLTVINRMFEESQLLQAK